MAGRTQHIGLAVHVLNASLRHPFLLAGQLAVAQAHSGRRVEVGIGTGSHPFARYDHEVAGIPFPPFAQRMAMLEACCRISLHCGAVRRSRTNRPGWWRPR